MFPRASASRSSALSVSARVRGIGLDIGAVDEADPVADSGTFMPISAKASETLWSLILELPLPSDSAEDAPAGTNPCGAAKEEGAWAARERAPRGEGGGILSAVAVDENADIALRAPSGQPLPSRRRRKLERTAPTGCRHYRAPGPCSFSSGG